MQGNYRHHYLATAKPAAQATITQTAPSQTRNTQVSVAADDCNGLPTSSPRHQQQQQSHIQHTSNNYLLPRPSYRLEQAHMFAPDHHHHHHHHHHQQQQQQQQYSRQQSSASRNNHSSMPRNNSPSNCSFHWPPSSDISSSRKSASTNQNNNNNNSSSSSWKNNVQRQNPSIACQQQYQNQPQFDDNQQERNSPKQAYDEDDTDRASSSSNLNDVQAGKNNYASQLRSSQLQYRFQYQQQQQQQQQGRMHQSNNSSASSKDKSAINATHPAPASSSSNKVSSSESRTSNSASGGRTIDEPRPLHVNFNRASRASGADKNDADEDDAEEGGSSRKKKYLTAKYGQQQMNLIKKRLKIEMWLYEQLKELTKGSKSEADLDEIDIDLDELLDMEDDSTRRHWLQKTLEPFEDVEANRINEFIDQVLEQSRLL